MMSTLHVWIFIYVLIIALCATRGNATPADGEDDSGERAVLLRRAFKQLLRLKSLPADRPDADLRPSVASPPRYMLELYERYRRGDANSAGKNRGNTVRSVLAQKGNINGAEMLLFNLSGIDTTVEDILHSELHFNRRKKVKWLDRSVDKPFFLMEFFIISSKDVQVKPLATVNITSRTILSGRRGGWQVLDVTKQVNECQKKFPDLSDDGDLNHLIAIKFRSLNRRSKLVDLSLRSLIRMDNMPFLIIFSNDKGNDTETVDDLDINMTQKFLKDSNEEQETRIKNDGTLMADDAISPLKRHPRSVGDNNHIEEFDYGVKQSTLMSWVDNNEYPENSVHSGQDFLAKTGPGILIPRKRHRMEQQANRTIPYPVVGGPFGHRRRMKKKKNATLPISWQDKIRKEKGKKIIAGLGSRGNDVGVKVVPSAKESDNVGCHRKRLSVDFADLHWGDRIISPKSFEAYYCAGRCQFPLVKESNPSNHAIIQSIVNAVGINQDVPAPCCVANAMSSLSLLYFEDNGIVVLKNYPGMIVESCACR